MRGGVGVSGIHRPRPVAAVGQRVPQSRHRQRALPVPAEVDRQQARNDHLHGMHAVVALGRNGVVNDHHIHALRRHSLDAVPQVVAQVGVGLEVLDGVPGDPLARGGAKQEARVPDHFW